MDAITITNDKIMDYREGIIAKRPRSGIMLGYEPGWLSN
jgi:hypothetical protein